MPISRETEEESLEKKKSGKHANLQNNRRKKNKSQNERRKPKK